MWVVASSGSDGAEGAGGAPSSVDGSRCPTSVGSGPATVGERAPTFVLRGLDGRCVDLSALQGQPVMVNFWASWCNPCRREFPLFRDALRRHRAEDLQLVAVVYQDIPSDARRFANQFGADWPLPVDPEGTAADAYGVRAIPQTFFIRRDGTIVSRLYGITSRRELEQELDGILR